MLKKNYVALFLSLPKTYMKTIDKMQEVLKVPNDIAAVFRKFCSYKEANEAIISFMFLEVKVEVDVLQFCDDIESILDLAASKQFINSLRSGM